MATLFKQKGSDKWWIRYSRNGKQVRKSTGTINEDEARLQLREVELTLEQKSVSGTVSQDLINSIQKESIRPTPIRTVFANRLKHVGPNTAGSYKARDGIFIAWLNEHYPEAELISDITRPMIKAFLDMISDHHQSRTHNGYLRRLRSVFRSAVKDGLCSNDPTVGVERLPEHESNRRAYTEDELRDLFAAAYGEILLLTTLGLYAGAMRMGDIIALKWSNIDLENESIRWRMSKRRGKPMEIAMHPRLKKELLKIRSEDRTGPVLPSFHGNRHRASEHFRQLMVKAGLKEDTRPDIHRRYMKRRREREKAEAEGKEYKPEPIIRNKHELDFHSLRYNFVSILKSNGCPEAIARSIMGHASAEVNAIYTQIDSESERKWVASLPDVSVSVFPRAGRIPT